MARPPLFRSKPIFVACARGKAAHGSPLLCFPNRLSQLTPTDWGVSSKDTQPHPGPAPAYKTPLKIPENGFFILSLRPLSSSRLCSRSGPATHRAAYHFTLCPRNQALLLLLVPFVNNVLKLWTTLRRKAVFHAPSKGAMHRT